MQLSSPTLRAQVYALSKERDALRRGSDKLSSAAGLLKEKDDIIQQARTRLHAAWTSPERVTPDTPPAAGHPAPQYSLGCHLLMSRGFATLIT